MPPNAVNRDARVSRLLRQRSWTSWGVYALLLGVVSMRAFVPTLFAGWTDTDALASVVCAGEGLASLARPLTCGWGGENANFWRPVAMAQFLFLRSVFGWNAAAWHVWALGLHVATALMLASVVRRAGVGRLAAAGAGLLFAAHPLGVEIVPAVARNLEIPFCLGFLGAMRFAGTSAFWPFALVAIGSKEAAVLLIPALFVTRPPRSIWTPLFLLFAAYLLGRQWVLGGLGGYGTSPSTFAWVAGPVELLFPAFGAQAPPIHGAGVAWAVAGWAAFAAAAWTAFRGPHQRLALAMTLVVVGSLALYAATGTYSRRLLYLPSAAWCVVVVLAATKMMAARSRLGVALFGMWLSSWVVGSPLYRPYTDWNRAGHAFDDWLVPDRWDAVLDGSTVWIVDRPARFDLDPRRVRYWADGFTMNHTASLYSIEAWVREFTGKTVHLAHISSISVGPAARPSQTERSLGGLRVTRTGTARKLATKSLFSLAEEGNTLAIEGVGGQSLWVWDEPAHTR